MGSPYSATSHLLLDLGVEIGGAGLCFLRVRREPIQTPLFGLKGLLGALHRLALRLQVQS